MNTPNSKKEEKRYFQLSPDTVPLLAETVGINGNSISPSVSRALAEDVSYRCRELANVSFEPFIHRANTFWVNMLKFSKQLIFKIWSAFFEEL